MISGFGNSKRPRNEFETVLTIFILCFLILVRLILIWYSVFEINSDGDL